ncbi:MAG TPA: hypothetical protein VHH15_07670 [Actinophytocola sp.]|nr:hypothetical protein [Actinophytocola sp.]
MTEQTGRRRMVTITVGAVVVLAVVGVVVYLLTRPDSEEATGPDVPTISNEAPPSDPPPAPSVSNPPAGKATGEVSVPPPADDEQAAARTVAEDAIDAINTQNLDAMTELACDPNAVGQAEDLTSGVTATLRENPTINGDEAKVQLELDIEGLEPQVVDLTLEKRQDGSWCVP